jgi:hypothetical protein
MRRVRKNIKRIIIFTAAFVFGVLPLITTNTYSNRPINDAEDSQAVQSDIPSVTQSGKGTTAPRQNSPTPKDQDTALYPCDISESEKNNTRQIVKTYEMGAGESPDRIPKENFENSGWRYVFTDITKKETEVNITKDHTVTVSIDSDTKDIDAIVSQLLPMLQYSSYDGFSGLLSLDVSTINLETSDTSDTAAAGSSAKYITTAEYKGTVAKLMNEKNIYSVYFTGTKITPTPMPVTPEPPPESDLLVNPPLKAAVIPICAALLCGVFLFFLFQRHVRVYNLNGDTYVPVGKARLGYVYPVINLTRFADKAVTGGFVLMLDRTAANRLSDKTVTINYGWKSLQHIVQYDGSEYQIEVDF